MGLLWTSQNDFVKIFAKFYLYFLNYKISTRTREFAIEYQKRYILRNCFSKNFVILSLYSVHVLMIWYFVSSSSLRFYEYITQHCVRHPV